MARRRYSFLVIDELALSLAVLVAAGLLMRASGRVRALDFGIGYERITKASLYSRATDSSVLTNQGAIDALTSGVRGLPGVEAVAWRSGTTLPRVTSARTGGGNREISGADVWMVSADYLRTMGIHLDAGRDFMSGDAFQQGVAIVDDSAARALWGADDPLGQRVSLGRWRTATSWIPVIGVARHTRTYGASLDFYRGTGAPTIYVVRPDLPTHQELVVRSRPDRVHDMTFAVRRYLRDVVPSGTSFSVVPLRETYDNAITAQVFLADMFLALALIALTISSFGVYAVLSYAVAQRRRDFAVRIALGASPGSVLLTVVKDAAVMVLAGTGIGAVVAMWSSQFVDSFLFDLYRIDVGSLVAGELVLMTVALAAAAVPAIRAARANPMDAIRAF